ncbi:MAG: hypothetical protein ACXADB_04455 [Candidatus Hermodarchaeia archaeon]|jgi:hypothetical protein
MPEPAIGFEPGFSVAVQNAADHVLRIDRPLEDQIQEMKGKKKKDKKPDDDDDWELDD